MTCNLATDPFRTLTTAAHVRVHTAAMHLVPGGAGHAGERTGQHGDEHDDEQGDGLDGDPVGGRLRGRRGQATTEYALILLAAALVGLMVVAWATAGGGAARISRLFNGVIDAVIEKV